jgi:Uma2 family endonuclease
MSTVKPRAASEAAYEKEARDYMQSLPLEHFMEGIAQARQREITVESMAVLKTRRPDIQVFNELLVQYPVPRRRRLGKVVPDNMVILSDQPVRAELSYNLPFEAARPFWVFEYVSKNNKRKDYKESFEKYERDLQVPYYLLFYPEEQDLNLYHHNGTKYVPVKPNKQGRLAIPELDLEVGLLDGWVRYWYQGDLLPLPEELQRQFEEAGRQAEDERQRAEEEKRRADELQQRLREAERALEQLRAERPPTPRRRNNRTHPEE